MGHLLFSLLLVFAAGAVGGALFVAYSTIRLCKLLRECGKSLPTRRGLWFIVTKLGIAVTQGVLVFALIRVADDHPHGGIGWLYAIGLVLVAVGVLGEALQVNANLAMLEYPDPDESPEDGPNGPDGLDTSPEHAEGRVE